MSVSAATVSVPDAPTSGHEHRTRTSEGKQTAQETPAEVGQVRTPPLESVTFYVSKAWVMNLANSFSIHFIYNEAKVHSCKCYWCI